MVSGTRALFKVEVEGKQGSSPKGATPPPQSPLEAGVWVLGWGLGPGGWDLGLEVGIWASRLVFGPREEQGGEGEGQNPPYVRNLRSSTPSELLPKKHTLASAHFWPGNSGNTASQWLGCG